MTAPARSHATFAQATCEVLETAVAPAIARALLERAAQASPWGRVPEDARDFRAFVEGALRTELVRVLDASEIAFVEERLEQVLGTAGEPRVSAGALHVGSEGSSHKSGSHRKVPAALEPAEPAAERRPTLPAPASSPPEGVLAVPRAPRSPLPPRAEVPSGVTKRATRLAPTARAMPRASSSAGLSCVLLVSADPTFHAQASGELAGHCPTIPITSPGDLPRAVMRGGDRIAILLDAARPSIELATFAGLTPILPVDARVILCGTDARTRAHLAAQFPVTRAWLACDGRTPAAYVLSLR